MSDSTSPQPPSSDAQAPTDRMAIRVVVYGRVQGVFYRNWTVKQALGLGLDGWVRNREVGTVEALFAGAPAIVADMIDRCRRGPTHARVSAIDTHPAADPGATGFHKLPTV